MLKYSRSALGFLNHQYQSVLKRCLLGSMLVISSSFLLSSGTANAADIEQDLIALAPNDAPVAQEVTVSMNNRLFRTIGNHLLEDSLGKKHGMNSGDPINQMSLFADGYYGESKLSRRGNHYGFNTDAMGFIVGMDKQINKNMKAGIGYQHDQTDVKAFHRKTDVDSNTGFVFAEYQPSPWFVNGIASYGRSSYREKKHAFDDTFKAKYHADVYAMQAMTGYEYIHKYVDMTPQIGMRYNYIKRHGYNDGAEQQVSGKDMDIWTGVAGVTLSKDLYGYNCMRFRPEIYAGITYDMESDRDNATVNFINGGGYTVNGKRLDRMGYEVGAGLNAEMTEHLSASLNYLGGFRDKYQNHTGLIGLKYTF